MAKTKTGQAQGCYTERDVSWMYFNYRVLQEAKDKSVPLGERLNFLGIYSSNLDEFFRVRVPVLKRIVTLGGIYPKQEQKTSQRTLKKVSDLYKKYALEFEETFVQLRREMEAESIHILTEAQITDGQRRQILALYTSSLNTHLYPRIFSQNTNFKDINDESVYLAVKISKAALPDEYALIEIPSPIFGRFIQLQPENTQDRQDRHKKTFMFLDDVIRVCLPNIFAGLGYESFDAYAFKLTKDAEIEIDNLHEDIIGKVDQAIKKRKWGQPVRFIYDSAIPADLLAQIHRIFHIRKSDSVVAGGRYHNLKDLSSFPLNRKDLKYPAWTPLGKKEIATADSIIRLIRGQDILLHYPYHSFSNYILLLREAAISKEVRAIKITLYRLAANSAVVEALICAAKNGKKVVAVVELMARFDEASNIYWSQKMQEAGVEVLLGIEGLKIHSKLTCIKGEKGDIACINTGNFHEGNAKAYTDLSLMTAHRNIVAEVNEVFRFIQKPYQTPRFKELLISPVNMRPSIKKLIQNEMKFARQGKPAYIRCKLNHVTDKEIIQKLYEASEAGVKVELLVRGGCSLVPGVEGVSANIQVKGIIDRYLEHSRIFIFCNGGRGKYYLGSADWIGRNFDSRVEVLTPVHDKKIQKELELIIKYGLKDNCKARSVDGNGNDQIPVVQAGEPVFRMQEELYKHYKKQTRGE